MATTAQPDVRPKTLAEYVGQPGVVAALSVRVQAARMRGEPLDHTLIYGPPGLGKTTLAEIVAHEMDGRLVRANGAAIERPGDIATALLGLQPGDCLFLDEIHALPGATQERLFTAMEDRRLEIMVGKPPATRSLSLTLAPFTLIGATTHAGKLSQPLRDRFGLLLRLEYYDAATLASIARRTGDVLGCPLTPDAATEVGGRSRGTPRVANRLVRALRDYAVVAGRASIDADLARASLADLGIDRAGLDAADRRMLATIIRDFNGGPVGLESLGAACGEASETIESAIEPYLMQAGFLGRTKQGRIATAKAWEHLGLTG